jgi:hypothetical protein
MSLVLLLTDTLFMWALTVISQPRQPDFNMTDFTKIDRHTLTDAVGKHKTSMASTSDTEGALVRDQSLHNQRYILRV